MTTYISVISHGHSELIKELSCLDSLVSTFKVVVKSNKPNDCFSHLNLSSNFYWIDEQYYCGFGHNNNIVFDYCQSELGMTECDNFIVLNPDVIISLDCINHLLVQMDIDKNKLAAINLFKDKEYDKYDNSIRQFPSLCQFIKSFLGFGNTSIIDKSKLSNSCYIDWAAGSFLAFKAGHYAQLCGFDEKYFMYCEDIDICYRSNEMQVPVVYYPNIKALHLAQHANRAVFSKHFYWHVSSVLRFLLTKINWTRTKSILK